MHKTLIFLSIATVMSMAITMEASNAYALDIITSWERPITIDKSVDVKFRVNNVDGTGITTTSVNGDNTLISDLQLDMLESRSNSAQEPNMAPHMSGFGQNLVGNSEYSFDGVDKISQLYNGGGNIKVIGWASQDSFDVYCHGDYLTTVNLGKGHSGYFEAYIGIPLNHQSHIDEILYETSDNGWLYQTTRTWVGTD